MKKKSLLAPLGVALLLSSCSPFVSHWSATIFVHSNTSHAASMTFDEFEGLIVFNLKSEDKEHSVLEYKLNLTEGKFNISYAYSEEEKYDIVTISGTEKKEGSVEFAKTGKVYLLVESEGKAKNGDFEFTITGEAK